MQNKIDRKSDFEKMTSFQETKDSKVILPSDKLINLVKNGNNVILCGPPGTGKTRAVELLFQTLKDDVGHYEIVQFHPSYSYQDFVEGYTIKDGKYEPKKGLLFEFIKKASATNDDSLKILVIDEMNRGDVPSIFGELMLLLDRGNRVVKTAKFGNVLSLPPNFVIIGTMNTADRNIKQLDLALRRRFKFIFVPPDYDGLHEWLNSYTFDFSEFSISQYVSAITQLNSRITRHPLLGKSMALGQSLFVPYVQGPITLKDLVDVFNEVVLPQLEAYIGLGNRKELDELFGTPEIRKKLDIASDIDAEDLVNIINLLNIAQD